MKEIMKKVAVKKRNFFTAAFFCGEMSRTAAAEKSDLRELAGLL